MNRSIPKRVTPLILAGMAVMACNHLPGPVEDHWGESVRDIRSAMVADPEAGTTPADPIDGLDSLSGEITVHNYEVDSKHVRKSNDDQIFLIQQP
ncbi:MAG: hypothetical protein AAEJ52_11330 [Myxococcota bacterium]